MEDPYRIQGDEIVKLTARAVAFATRTTVSIRRDVAGPTLDLGKHDLQFGDAVIDWDRHPDGGRRPFYWASMRQLSCIEAVNLNVEACSVRKDLSFIERSVLALRRRVFAARATSRAPIDRPMTRG